MDGNFHVFQTSKLQDRLLTGTYCDNELWLDARDYTNAVQRNLLTFRHLQGALRKVYEELSKKGC